MDWTEYKQICERPDCFSRFAINLTRSVVADEVLLGQLASMVLRGTAVEKPADHRGDARADFFLLDLDPAVIRVIIRQLAPLAAQDRRMAHLRVVWQEYLAAATRRIP